MPSKFNGIALIIFLSYLPMQVIFCDRVIAEVRTDRQTEADRLLKQGYQQNETAQYFKAIESLQKALEIFRLLKNPVGESRSLIELGIAYRRLSQHPKAINLLQQALEISKQNGNRNEESDALNNLGDNYLDLGQYQKAIDLHQQALVIASQIGDRNGESEALRQIGASYRYLGQYQKALNFFQQALVIAKQIGNRSVESDALISLGAVYKDLGQYQKAIDFYQQALVIKQQIGERDDESVVLGSLATVYSILKQYPKAINLHQQALVIKQQIGNPNGVAISLANLGRIYSDLKQYQKSIELSNQALAIFKQTGNRNAEGRTLGNLGLAYGGQGQQQKAIDYYQQSLVVKREIGDRYGEEITLKYIGVLLSELNQPELAILFYKQSVNVTESIRKDIRGLSKEEQKSYLSTAENTYRDLADLLLQQGRVIEALQILDLLKIQELEDYLKNVKGNNRTAQGIKLLVPEELISRQLSVANFEQIPQLNRELATKIQQLPKSEINKVPEYLQKLPQGAVLIYPLILSDRLELIAFSANTLPINRTVKIEKAELEKLITDFRTDLQDFSSVDVKDSSEKLYNVLIKPIESDLKQVNANTILYAPDGILRYVPLVALYNGKQWLVEKYRVNNLIAYSLFDPDRKPQSDLHIFAGAFGGKVGETRFGLGGLPSTIPEVDNIAATFANTTRLTEKDFTARATKKKVIGQAIVHFATHAEFKPSSPDDSYILFGDGSKVTLAEINEWRLKDTDLVVLSACQTGVGSLGTGAEILGFGYQVQRAGAKASIASLWKVSDGGTQLLMNRFYGELQKGNVSTSTALREAQLNMIRRPAIEGKVNFNHPYFWSAFILIGNGL